MTYREAATIANARLVSAPIDPDAMATARAILAAGEAGPARVGRCTGRVRRNAIGAKRAFAFMGGV